MGFGIPARGKTEPSLIHVLPLRNGTTRGSLAQRVSAAMFIAPAAVPPRMPIDALTLIYDLMPAEARIFEMVSFEMVSAGSTQAAIAGALGIATSTVKTHVLHLFEKTGCARQADLYQAGRKPVGTALACFHSTAVAALSSPEAATLFRPSST